ncbi:MAG: hypothetical protein ACJAWW_002142 [Sulfurimonas sp.]|jgi:hypothetical protein
MNYREEYQQEKQAILDDYKEELNELKEMASASKLDATPELDKEIKILEIKLKDAKAQLKAVANVSEEEVESHKKAIDDTFRSIYSHLAMS